jgi:hypothetical protein
MKHIFDKSSEEEFNNQLALCLLGCRFPSQLLGMLAQEGLMQCRVMSALSQLESKLAARLHLVNVKADAFGIPIWIAACPACCNFSLEVNTYTHQATCGTCGETGSCDQLVSVDDTF